MPSIKRLFSGAAPIGLTSVYTVPAGKKAIIKSIVVSNRDSADQPITIWINSIAFVEDHIVKAFDSLVLPAAGLILNSGEQLYVGGTSSNVNVRVTGELVEAEDVDQPFYVTRGVSLGITPTGTTYTNTNHDTLIKSVTFCNRTNVAMTITMIMGGTYIFSKSIKARDTLTIPFLDQILIKGEVLQVYASSTSSVSCMVTGLLVRNNA